MYQYSSVLTYQSQYVSDVNGFCFPPYSFSYVVTASSPNMIIAVSTTAASPDQQVAVDDVTLEEIHDVASVDSSSEPAVRSSSVFLPEWSVVQTSWHFVDDVSPIVDYQWALGELAVTACFLRPYSCRWCLSIQLSCLCSYNCHWCLCPYSCHTCANTAVMCIYTAGCLDESSWLKWNILKVSCYVSVDETCCRYAFMSALMKSRVGQPSCLFWWNFVCQLLNIVCWILPCVTGWSASLVFVSLEGSHGRIHSSPSAERLEDWRVSRGF